MGSDCQDLLPKLVLQLGQSLDLTTRTSAKTGEVAALCDHVAPDMVALRTGLSEVGASALLGVLPMMLDLKIPAT